MREQRFRGRAKQGGWMLEGQLVRTSDGENRKWFLCGDNLCLTSDNEVDYETLQEYTQEEDDIDTPIYEGDQLLVFNRTEPIEKARMVTVIWDENYSGFSTKPLLPNCTCLASVLENYDVVVVMAVNDDQLDS